MNPIEREREREKTWREVPVLDMREKTPDNYSTENPTCHVGTEKPNPRSAPSGIQTGVHRVEIEGSAKLIDTDIQYNMNL